MNIITRRSVLATGTAAAASLALPNFAMSAIPVVDATPPKLPIENGATLRVLRPTKFVGPDEEIFRENIAKFTAQTGVAVRVDFVGWEDLRPQVGVAANTGAGPDVVVGWPDDPHLFSDKLVEVSDIAEYSLASCARVLTFIARRDRISEGFMAGHLENGQILLALDRARTLVSPNRKSSWF